MARHINLLDPPKKEHSPYTAALQLVVPVALVLLVMGSWVGIARYQLASAKQRLNDVEAHIRPVREEQSQLQAGMGSEQKNVVLREQIAAVETQLAARTSVQNALRRGAIGSTQGFSSVMQAFARQTVQGVWLTGLILDNAGRDITLSGRALNGEAVASLVRALRAEPALKGRSIETMRLAPVPPPTDESSAPHIARVRIYEFQLSSVASTPEAQQTAEPAPTHVSLGDSVAKVVSTLTQ